MNIIEKLFHIPKEFYNTKICEMEIRNTNRIIYNIWYILMLCMNISTILLSLYYIIFVEGEAQIIGNYLYIILYLFQIGFITYYRKIFYDESMEIDNYSHKIDIFIYESMIWVLVASCLDLYYTGSYSAFVGGIIDMSILYLKPKRFGYITTIDTILYCLFMIFITLDSSRDELGNIVFENTILIEIINTLFNLGILVFTLIFFIHIKYNSKVSDIYKSAQLQELSNRDILTGLYNRMSLTHYIEDINKSKENSIIVSMVDIDNFKSINDTYGHPIGDKCIHLVGEEINKISQKGYRYGGEEFLIIFECVEKSKVLDIMENFRMNVANSETCGVKFTVSIGVSDTFSATDITKYIEQADSRLYIAKRTGKNKIICE
ncbi:MAG: GGDEF domain-containing protein [Oscillospiraceae bacterium]